MLRPNSYFDAHALPLGEACRNDLGVWVETATMVLLSIQQPWHKLPIQFHDVRENGRQSKYLWGFKSNGFDFLLAHGSRLHKAARVAHAANDLDGLIWAYLEIPGLGLVKASFLAQLTIGQGACLDVHNLKRFGFKPDAFKLPKSLKAETIHSKIRLYNAAWSAHGDSRFWWDTWCDHLAKRHKAHYKSGHDVSVIHTLPLT